MCKQSSLVCLFYCNWNVNWNLLLIKNVFFFTQQYRTAYSTSHVVKLIVSCLLPNLVVHNRVRKNLPMDCSWTKWIQSTKYTALTELKLLRKQNYWKSLNTFSNSKLMPFFSFQNAIEVLEIKLSVLSWESNLKLKIILCVINHHTLKTRGEVGYLYSFLNSALGEVRRSFG
jgi:hypothetical protein